MYRHLKIVITLSVLWAATAGAAPPQLTEAEQAAVDACFELEDERAAAACLDGLALALPPEIQSIIDVLANPATTDALDRWQQATDAATAAHAEALAARGTPRDLLAAVLLTPPEVTDGADDYAAVLPAHAVSWFDAARNATPADPLVAWMEATSCPATNLGCDRDAAIARLLQVDAGNAAVHLLTLHQAHVAGDATAARAYPSETPPAPEDLQAIAAVGQWAALSIPPLQPLAELCGDGAAADAALRQDCIAVLASIAGNTGMLLYPAFALDLLVRLESDARWREQLRRHAWLYEQGVALQPLLPDARGAVHARLLAERGEVGAWQALLERNSNRTRTGCRRTRAGAH